MSSIFKIKDPKQTKFFWNTWNMITKLEQNCISHDTKDTHLVCFGGKSAKFTDGSQTRRLSVYGQISFHLPFQSHSFVTKTNSSGWEQLRKKNTFLHVQACWSGNTCKGLDCDQFQVKPCSLMYVCVHFNPSETPRLWETDGSERKSPPPSKRQSRTQVNKCWRRRQALAEARP